jgi:hypothetical protein
MGLADVVSSPTPRTEEAGFDLDSALDEILAGLGSGGPAIDETALGRAEEDTLSLEQELAALALAPRDALVGERMAAAAMALEDYPAAIRHYLEFLSTIEDPRNGRDKLDKLSQPP